MKKVLIIGFGIMGQAIGKNLIKENFQVWASDSDTKKIKSVKGVKVLQELDGLAIFDAIIIAVKPQNFSELAKQVKDKISKNTVLVSIAAGVKIEMLIKLFHHRKIIRMMPNLGLSVGQGIAAWKSAGLSPADKKRAKKLLNAISENFEISNEKLIDSVTAISGSGPAYFFLFADSLASSAKKLGLTSVQSEMLVKKTLSAASKLSENGKYQELINRVASKGGTTEAALRVFKKHQLDNIVEQAAKAAHKRAGELSAM